MVNTIDWGEYPDKIVELDAENLNKIPKSFAEQVLEQTSGVFSNKVKSAVEADDVINRNATTIDGVELDEIFEEDGKTFKVAYSADYTEHSNTTDFAETAQHANVANKLIGAQEKLYDITIRTQAEFEDLIASPTWLDATSVLFVGDGGTLEYSSPSVILTVPNTVKIVNGINSVVLKIGVLGDRSYFQYGEDIPVEDYMFYSIKNISLKHSAFRRFVNMSGCKGLFVNCHYIENCFGSFLSGLRTSFSQSTYISNSIGRAPLSFSNCSYITNCSVDFDGSNYAEPIISGFRQCNYVTNCSSTVSNNVVDGIAAGFSNCNFITNSSAKATATGGSTGIGYISCSYGSNNIDLGSTASATSDVIKWPSEINDI